MPKSPLLEWSLASSAGTPHLLPRQEEVEEGGRRGGGCLVARSTTRLYSQAVQW